MKTDPDSTSRPLSRRNALKSGVLSAAAIGFPTIVPRSVFGENAPSNRVTTALIGHGLMMKGHRRVMLGRKDVQVLAVCDVDRKKREQAKDQANRAYADEKASGTYQGCEAYNEYEWIIERNDIDACLIATPDHWHAPISIAALRSGKDVYCEKPMTLTIKEGRIVSDTAKRYGRILQTGSQQRSDRAFRTAAEIVRNGLIGRVHTIYTRLGAFPQPTDFAEEPVPEGFDYDRWLGPTPWVPFNAERVKGNYGGGWRRFWEYGSRKNGDWGAHHFDIIQWALGMDASGPTEFIPKGYRGESYQTHVYANGVRVMRDHPIKGDHMIQFIGTEGEVMVSRGGKILTTPRTLLDDVRANGVKEALYESESHHDNWIDGIRTRKPTICNAEIGHRSATICHLSGIAERLGRPLKWDPKKEEILGDPAASRWMDRPRRAPYAL